MQSRTGLLLCVLVLASNLAHATWTRIDPRGVSAIDFYSAHLGLVAFADPAHTLMRIKDSSFVGVWPAPGAISGIAIQDSMRAWVTIAGHGLYLGDKAWSNWTNVNARSDLTLVGA